MSDQGQWQGAGAEVYEHSPGFERVSPVCP